MSLDKLSTEDLMALREGNFEAMSTEGLKAYRDMQAPQQPQSSTWQDAKDVGIALGANLADAASQNASSLITGAAGAYGANQIRKGLLGMGSRAAGAPAAATPAGAPAPAGGMPSNAGAGTPQQQAAAKSATQNLRSQQLHGTLPANQAAQLGGSKAWTVNPSGIITPDDAMQRAPTQTAASAPQQGRMAQAAGKLKGAGQTIINSAGQAMGKIPMGQAAKLLAKGAARFVPGVGLVLLGADAIEGGMKLYDAHKQGKLNTRNEMDGQGAIGAANGGRMTKDQVNNMMTEMRVGNANRAMDNAKISPWTPEAQMQSYGMTREQWMQATDGGKVPLMDTRNLTGYNYSPFRKADGGPIHMAGGGKPGLWDDIKYAVGQNTGMGNVNILPEQHAWITNNPRYRDMENQIAAMEKAQTSYAQDPRLTALNQQKGQYYSDMAKKWKPSYGSGMPIGMMKAQIGNKKAGGSVL